MIKDRAILLADRRESPRIIRSVWRNGLTAACLLLLATGCAEINLATHVAKTIGGGPEKTQADSGYKVGKPYQIKGIWYYPKADYSYDETGIASWYGSKFHGRPTANGERFDMHAVSAAHKTLPLPSFVRVTNLDNGRAMNIRINDRGPFVHGRIIDLSRRAAELLGFRKQGTARVRVTILPWESRQAALRGGGKVPANTVEKVSASPRDSVASSALQPLADTPVRPGDDAPVTKERTPKPNSALATVRQSRLQSATAANTGKEKLRVDRQPVKPNFLYIQAGAFSDIHNANRLKTLLKSLGQASVTPAMVGERLFYRVRVGPLPNTAEADRVLERMIQSGHTDARITIIE